MKVLHVIPAVAPRYGGPSAAIASMCRSLAGEGIDTTLAATDADGDGRIDVPIETPTMWDGVAAIFFRRDRSESFKYSGGLRRWMARSVGQFAVVHVHAVLSHAPLAAAAACRRAGVPYVVRPLGTLDPWSLGQKPIRKRALLALAGRRMLEGAAAIHYTTDEERDAVERTLNLSRGVVIPLGVDDEWLRGRVPSAETRRRDRYVVVVSRLHHKKNLEALVQAFAALVGGSRAHADWRLAIAGDGDPAYVEGLRQLAVQLGVERRVEFMGWIEGDVKRRLVANASLYVLPSMQENFGVSVLEAMAAGVPALVSPHVNLASAIRAAGAGWIADADPVSLGTALNAAMSDEREREARGRAARQLAQEYAWPRIAQQLAALYRRLAEKPAATCVA